jgi:hypothetical protein
VKQTTAGYESAAAASLIDLVPTSDAFIVPEALIELAHEPRAVIEWSIREQQLSFLEKVRRQREYVTTLRRESLLADAKMALKEANETYNELAFASFDNAGLHKAELLKEQAQARVAALSWQFEHEDACSLGPTRVIGVVAVFSLAEAPEEDLVDERPDIGITAEKLARRYEEHQGRDAKNVSGEHDLYPYDLHSSGPGGVRCIEVKGTTTGRILLRENQRRAAKRLGRSYYLYIVRDPLGDQPHLTIVRDPLSKMNHDDVLYSGARYVYDAATWHAASDEETTL